MIIRVVEPGTEVWPGVVVRDDNAVHDLIRRLLYVTPDMLEVIKTGFPDQKIRGPVLAGPLR